MPPKDERGRYDHSKQRTSAHKLRRAEEHIASIPTYESHYTRAHSETQRYLSYDLSVPKLYDMYIERCNQENDQPIKLWQYRSIFDTKFNLAFKPPQKDTCKKCDLYKAEVAGLPDTARRATISAEHEVHLRKADAARHSLNSEKNQLDDSHDAITFDLQKVMSFPRLSTNEVYYCRQLSVFNLGIHRLKTGDGIMHVWPESVASRGPDEISSCLLNYCIQASSEGVKHITAFSDSCGGQNRNYKIVLMWMFICSTTSIRLIDHKYMMSGHSFLPNDSDFGVIEMLTKKSTDLFIPDHWFDIIRKSNRKKPFQVVKMDRAMFFSVEKMAKYSTIRKRSITGDKVEWLRIQWIQIRKDEPFNMYYKYTLQDDDEFSCVSFQCRGRPASMPQNLEPLYNEPRLLSAEKVSDISKLLKYVPPIYHDYYLQLKASHGNENNDSNEEPVDENNNTEVLYCNLHVNKLSFILTRHVIVDRMIIIL